MSPVSDESHPDRRKRRRKALSCLECRRRKVKCDRNVPRCNRCLETGDAVNCVYTSVAQNLRDHEDGESQASGEENDHLRGRNFNGGTLNTPASTATASHDAAEDVSFSLREQARKIAQLESRLASLESPQLQVSDHVQPRVVAGIKRKNNSKSPDRNSRDKPQEIVFLRGKCFKTVFQGASCPISSLADLPELGQFVREVIASNPVISQTRRDLKIFTEKRKKLVGAGLIGGVDDLLCLVPERNIANSQINKYLETVETAFHILHVPSFTKEYNDFWEEPSKARPAFVALLLLAISTVSCLCPDGERVYIGDSSRGRELALRRIEACDAWIEKQSLKHVNLTTFQLRCLSLLAKQMTKMRMKAYFTSAGSLLRAGLTNGLHRDPVTFPKKQSPFNQEMRKRLFATMMELELQASIDLGLPSQSASLPYDCPPPSNINDEELPPLSNCPREAPLVEEHNPMSYPPEVFTMSSYLHLSGRSLPLRIHINTRINDHTSPLTYSDILILQDEITNELNSLPRWPDTRASKLPRLLLDVQLRQFLLLIHAPFAAQRIADSRADYSRTVCMNAASSIISQHTAAVDAGLVAANQMRQDVLRAALSLSQNVFLSTITMSTTIKPSLSLFPTYEPLLKSALSVQSVALLRLGRTYQDFYRMSALHGLVMSRLSQDPEAADLQKKETAERGAILYRHVLDNQELAGGRHGEDDEMVGGVAAPSGVFDSIGSQQIMVGSDMQIGGYEIEDMGGWNWDSLWSFDGTDQETY